MTKSTFSSAAVKRRITLFALVLAVLWGQTFSAAAFQSRPAPAAKADTPAATVEALFSPHDDIEKAILHLLRGARRTIYVQAYLFTDRTLAAALIDAKARGVRVEMLADRERTVRGENSQIPRLVDAGIPVALEVRYANAHNKILLIDATSRNGGAVVTGSYNFTWTAQTRNAENIVILRNNPALSRAYLNNWKRHRAEALPYAEALAAE